MPRKKAEKRDDELLARDCAVKLSFDELLLKHGFRTYEALDRVLKRPHIQRKIRAAQKAADEAEERIKKRIAMRGDDIAERLLERALNPDDPNHHSIATWAIEKIAPTTQKHEVKRPGDADPELLGQFVEAVDRLESLAGRKRQEPDLEAISHLRSGKDMIADRDREILPETASP